MSSPQHVVLLDTDVISNFHKAGELRWLIRLWKGKFVVAAEVLREIVQWPTQGKRVKEILDEAIRDGILSTVYIERGEFDLYTSLRERLGSGEAASIAIAAHRGHAVATDDRAARKLCRKQNPAVQVYSTEDFLELAAANGHLTPEKAQQIWRRMRVADPRRGIH